MMLNDAQLREVFHFFFLERLLKISDPTLYVLKGGVNLRFFFNSPRYSEDMDIDVLAGSIGTLRKNGYKILQEASFIRGLRTYGIAELEINDPNKAKQTATTQRFRLRLVTPSGQRLPTKVEFSRRGAAAEDSQSELVNPQIARQYRKLAFRCRHYPGELAALQKVQALAGRPATQARDVFDLGLLHAGGYTGSLRANPSLTRPLRQQALGALLSLTFTDFTGQVVEFLDQENQDLYGPMNAWEQLRETVFGLLEDA